MTPKTAGKLGFFFMADTPFSLSAANMSDLLFDNMIARVQSSCQYTQAKGLTKSAIRIYFHLHFLVILPIL